MSIYPANTSKSVQRRLVRAGVVLATVLFLAGCNIFSPFHNSGTSDDVDDLISDAYEALDQEKYQKAMGIMDKAMRISPNDPRVRYLHAVTAVKSRDIDLLDVVEIFQPTEGGGTPVDTENERVLFLSGAELKNLFDAFTIVSVDLRPLVEQIASTGRELSKIRESGDVLMSYGISETLVGILRVLDNDDTEKEFSVDDLVIFEKSEDSYVIRIDDEFLDDEEKDRLIDEAVDRSWKHFVEGRRAFFYYYQFVINEVIWTGGVEDPPAPLPEIVENESVVGSMTDFVDKGVLALYDEKEDL